MKIIIFKIYIYNLTYMIGIAKAIVFPDPVSANPMISKVENK
jgi:hypothetical protein